MKINDLNELIDKMKQRKSPKTTISLNELMELKDDIDSITINNDVPPTTIKVEAGRFNDD